MPPEANAVAAAREWLRYARSNLGLAKLAKPPDVLWEDLCFEAQQAAEKAVKAVLVFRGIDFPKTHLIADLLVILSCSGEAVPEELWRADLLSDYAVTTRYPRRGASLGEPEYRSAVEVSERVVQWAEAIIGGATKD